MTRTSSWKQPANTYREVRGRKCFETARAVHIEVTHISGTQINPKKEWFPISQIQKSVYDPIALTWAGMVAEWILEKNGLLDAMEKEVDDEDDPGDDTPEAYAPDPDDIPF